jgi:hypothetical protein
MHDRLRALARTSVLTMLFVGAFTGPALASHWAHNGWQDKHWGYPARPSGLTAINNTFGTRCTEGNQIIMLRWYTADDGNTYTVKMHKKVGGREVAGFSPNDGGSSTNLDHDVRGHIGNSHYDADVKSGIWGYNCRQIDGSTKWSTHSWGIALDQNARYEHVGSAHHHAHSVTSRVANIWQSHNWYWGINFGDAMHFQYATDY